MDKDNSHEEEEFGDISIVPNPDLDDNQESIDKENDDNLENDNVYTESEYENKDEIYTKNEYGKDDSLNIENPKTYDGILNSIIILIISLLLIHISIIIIKRNANGKI